MVSWTALRDRYGERHPDLRVEVVAHEDTEWLSLTVSLGPVTGYDRYIILRHNFDLAVGQVIESDGVYHLRQTLPLAHAMEENVDDAVEALVAEVSRTRASYEAGGHPR